MELQLQTAKYTSTALSQYGSFVLYKISFVACFLPGIFSFLCELLILVCTVQINPRQLYYNHYSSFLVSSNFLVLLFSILYINYIIIIDFIVPHITSVSGSQTGRRLNRRMKINSEGICAGTKSCRIFF